jgi:hypothetical protein
MAGRSVLEWDLVPRLERARGQGLHVADPCVVRSPRGASATELGAPRRLETVRTDIGPRCTRQASKLGVSCSCTTGRIDRFLRSAARPGRSRMNSWFWPWVRRKTLASIGIGRLRSATPCARRSPRTVNRRVQAGHRQFLRTSRCRARQGARLDRRVKRDRTTREEPVDADPQLLRKARDGIRRAFNPQAH